MTGAFRGLTVIICTWNRAGSLEATLESLSRQSAASLPQIEVLVVDNNSTDDTKAVVARLASDWRLGSLRYTFEPRQGKQFALNRGIRETNGDVLAFTDDDVFFPPDWLQEVWRNFEDETIELAGGKTLAVWPDGDPPSWYHASMSAVVADIDLGEVRLQPPPVEYAPAGSNLIARRSLVERVGGFAETLFRHMDYEFGQRCMRSGARVVYVPELVVLAPVSPKCLTKRYFRRWSFKAGILAASPRTDPCSKTQGLPLWIYRRSVEDLLYVAFWRPFAKEQDAFFRELRLWRALGSIASYWRRRLRPVQYNRWVEDRAQKKNDSY